ncbi:MAG: O-antigen ligase family protein [Cyanobacteria bacterium J06643_5]
MFNNQLLSPRFRLGLFISLIGIGIGLFSGFLVGANPQLLGATLILAVLIIWFFAKFEQAVISLLVLRSSLDIFYAQQIPAAFAVGLDALTLLYVITQLLTGKPVRLDKFWWFFAGWVALQGVSVILLSLGGLGLDSSHLPEAIREWVRLFSWLMAYLLIMQLQKRMHPHQIINALFLSLVGPLAAATLQLILPSSLLPPLLAPRARALTDIEGASRINGTLGHANTFATFLIFFLGLTYWKLEKSQQRWTWLLLMGVITFFIVSTKTLIGLVMTSVLMIVLIAPKFSPLKLIGGIILLIVIFGLFASTDFGRERLASVADTPLFNPDMDVSRSILLSHSDGNSFNWRLAHWDHLLKAWKQSPILGYGLGATPVVGGNEAHNDYVRWLVEGGVVGLGLFLAFLGANIARLAKLWFSSPPGSSQREISLVLIATLLAITVGMITENIWSHTALFFYWISICAIAGWDWNDSQIVEK